MATNGSRRVSGMAGVRLWRTVVSSRIRSEFGRLGERVRRKPTHCLVDGVLPGIVLSWSSTSTGWAALVAYGDENGMLHVGTLVAERLRPL
jgi:hypothetical protein